MIDVQAELEQPVTNIRGIGEETAKTTRGVEYFHHSRPAVLFSFPV